MLPITEPRKAHDQLTSQWQLCCLNTQSCRQQHNICFQELGSFRKWLFDAFQQGGVVAAEAASRKFLLWPWTTPSHAKILGGLVVVTTGLVGLLPMQGLEDEGEGRPKRLEEGAKDENLNGSR